MDGIIGDLLIGVANTSVRKQKTARLVKLTQEQVKALSITNHYPGSVLL